MKKLLMAIAGAVAIAFTAGAANENWFDGGIASGFPTAGSTSGGAWANTADQAEWDATAEAVVVTADTPVEFTMTSAKTLGTNAKVLTFNSSIVFTPFDDATKITNVVDAKAGVAVVSNADEYVYYVLAKDGETNKWTATSIAGPTPDAEVDVSIVVTNGANGGSAVYTFGSESFGPVDIVLAGSSEAFSKVALVGDCEMTNLVGFCDSTATLKIPADQSAYASVVVSNETAGAVVEKTGDGYNFNVGDAAAVYYYAKPGYLFTDGSSVKKYTGTMNKDIDLSAKTPDVPEKAEAVVNGSVYYLSFVDGALKAAQDGDVVTLCKEVTLTAALTIDKAITLNLDGNTINLPPMPTSGWIQAIKLTADNTVVSNGTIKSSATANYEKAMALVAWHADVLLKDLDVDAAHYGYGVLANCDGVWNASDALNYQEMYKQTSFKTLTLENVDVTGNGTLFELEGMNVSLDADCSATKDGNTPFKYMAAIYCAGNARTTIAGGTYSFEGGNALLTGVLPGQITVNDGTFTGAIASYMTDDDTTKMSYPQYGNAVVTINNGDFTGSFTEYWAQSTNIVWATKGGTFSVKPADRYIASGYWAKETAGGKYQVVAKGGFAIILAGATEPSNWFDTIQEAFEKVPVNGTVKLFANATITARLMVTNTFTLNMNGFTINTTPVDTLRSETIMILSNGNLTVTGNGTFNGPTLADYAAATAVDSQSVICIAGGTLTFLDGAINANGINDCGMYGVYVLNGGTATFGTADGETQPVITAWFAAIGSNHDTAPATITVNNGTYTQQADGTDKWWSYFCGAIYAASAGNYTINGGTFTGALYSFSTIYTDVNQAVAFNGGTYTTPIFYGEVAATSAVGTRTIAKGNDVEIALAGTNSDNIYWKGNTLAKYFNAGSGTAADPYQIAVVADLVSLDTYTRAGKTVGKYFEQTADIDMSTWKEGGVQVAWSGIGEKYEYNQYGGKAQYGVNPPVPNTAFMAVYDGKGHKIQNVLFACGDYTGVFNSTLEATIQNLTVENISFPAGKNGFGIVGNVWDGTILSNLTFAGVMGTLASPITANAGGIAVSAKSGVAGYPVLIKDCVNAGTLYGAKNDNGGKHLKLGGIVGLTQTNFGEVIIDGCVNEGTVSIDADWQDTGACGVGAIVGDLSTGKLYLKNCVNSGTVENIATTEDPLASGHYAVKLGALIGVGDNGMTLAANQGGCVAPTSLPAIGGYYNNGSATKTTGFTYATIAGEVATYVPDADLEKDTPYTLMMPVETATTVFTLAAENDTFILNTNGLAFAGTVDAATSLKAIPATVGTTITYTATKCAAKIGSVYYLTLQDAIDVGGKVELLANVTEDITIAADKTVDLDLGGYTLTAVGDWAIQNNGTLTITNGTVSARFPIRAWNNSTTTINGGTYTSVDGAVTVKGANNVVVINGGTFTASDNLVLTTNGTTDYSGNTITVNGGTFTSNIKTAGYIAGGVYAANGDTWYLNGGKFIVNGGVGVCARAGTVIIDGAEFYVTAPAAPGKVGDKPQAIPGALIAYDASDPKYPGYDVDTAKIEINDVTITDGGLNNVSLLGEATIKNTSGVALAAPEGYVWASDGTLTKAGAKIGSVYYLTLADAIKDAKADDTITLLADATGDGLEIATAVTFDLNGYQFTVNEGAVFTNSAAITLQNAVPGQGGFLNEGTIFVKESLDLSAFQWAAGGLIGTDKKTSRIAISAGKTVTFQGDWLKAMLANNANFFDGSETGAQFIGNGKVYVYDSTDGFALWQGLGTEASPWQIATRDDFDSLREWTAAGKTTAGKFWAQTAEIDMGGTAKPFDGIGVMSGVCFKGTFDGQNYAIKNVYFSYRKYGGFFNRIQAATIKNSTIYFGGFVGTAPDEYGCAAFVGDGNPAGNKLINLTARMVEGVTEIVVNHNSAGIVASYDRGTGDAIVACTNYLNITSTTGNKQGGIVGFKQKSGGTWVMKDCVNYGNISMGAANGTGGLIGYMGDKNGEGGVISFVNCANYGTITAGNEKVGELCGCILGDCEIVVDGFVAAADKVAVNKDSSFTGSVTGLDFAEIDNVKNLATYTTPAESGTYKVMASGAAFNFATDGWIKFDESAYAATVTTTGASPSYKKVATVDEGENVTLYKVQYKYYATVYTNNVATTWAGLGTGDSFYDEGVSVAVTNSGVLSLEIAPGKTFYVSKLVLNGDPAQYCEFTYSGSQLEKTGEGTLAVEILDNTNLAYTVVTRDGANRCFGAVYLTEYVSEGPQPGSGSSTDVQPAKDPSTGETIKDSYVITPTSDNNTVVVEGVKATDTLIITNASIMTLGCDAQPKEVKVLTPNGTSTPYDITAACKGFTGNTFDASLDGNKYVDVGGESIKVQPTAIEADSTEGTIADGAIATKSIPGLTYKLVRDDTAPSGSFETQADSELATSATVTLKDETSSKPQTKAFYKIIVTK